MSVVSQPSSHRGLPAPPARALSPGPWTLADAYGGAFPDDRHKWELLDGMRLVSPAPRVRHQSVVLVLSRVLHDAAPRGLFVLPGTNLDEEPDTNLEPDIAVCRVADQDLPATRMRPLLVVEVAPPSTRRVDRTAKRDKYAAMGVPTYWLVDADIPELVALELAPGGGYAEVAGVTGDEIYDAQRPFPVRVVPAELLADLQQ